MLQVDSVPTELMAYTKGPRLSAVRRDRDLMTWRMRQLRKCMMEVGWHPESLVELKPDSHMGRGRSRQLSKRMLEVCSMMRLGSMPNIGGRRILCLRWVRC